LKKLLKVAEQLYKNVRPLSKNKRFKNCLLKKRSVWVGGRMGECKIVVRD
jgi:hypothetical protein